MMWCDVMGLCAVKYMKLVLFQWDLRLTSKDYLILMFISINYWFEMLKLKG